MPLPFTISPHCHCEACLASCGNPFSFPVILSAAKDPPFRTHCTSVPYVGTGLPDGPFRTTVENAFMHSAAARSERIDPFCFIKAAFNY